MKRGLITFYILLLLVSLGSAAEENQSKKSFSLIIKGGWGTARIGDINAYYKTRCADEIFNIPENEGNKVPQLSSGFVALEIEGQYALNNHLSLGLSLGYPIIKSDKAIWYVNFNGSLQPVVLKPKVTVYFPIKLNLYYHLPLSSRVQLLIGGGPGIYPTEIGPPFYVFSHFPLGLQAVSKLEINLSQKLSLVFDGEWRMAKITNFKGDDYFGNEGTLWYYKMSYLGSDIWMDMLSVEKSAPTEDPLGETFYKDQRKAIFDLSGFSIRAGICFKL
ncbi:MAG: outer membrane beta-barrel protein [Candidatus Saccharicenans sp.]